MLLDELGSSTDPEEGGALGIVVLEAFRNRGAFALATTHLTPMKIYGASARGVRNGSMGFDEELTLRKVEEVRNRRLYQSERKQRARSFVTMKYRSKSPLHG